MFANHVLAIHGCICVLACRQRDRRGLCARALAMLRLPDLSAIQIALC